MPTNEMEQVLFILTLHHCTGWILGVYKLLVHHHKTVAFLALQAEPAPLIQFGTSQQGFTLSWICTTGVLPHLYCYFSAST